MFAYFAIDEKLSVGGYAVSYSATTIIHMVKFLRLGINKHAVKSEFQLSWVLTIIPKQ